VTQLGISMAAAIFIGIFIGSFLDKTFNTSPVLLLIFTVIGIGAAFINLYKLTIDFYQKKADNIKDEKGGH
ncbi:MAG: AtpZ/AtpI family protein, partial [Clostridiales bacterium]|jgi:F0F1-type ATP synthase assembly protein I|nr:AtpZ/AtpI family protein [Clostridiales bacterium]